MVRRASLLALTMALLALVALVVIHGSTALDDRFTESRFVVTRERCDLVEYQRNVFMETCPPGFGDYD